SGNCSRMMKTRILVVADNAALRATLARWLLRAGYAAELAESRRHAHEVISKAGIALAIVAPQGLGASAAELARELADEVGHVIVIKEPDDGAAAPTVSLIQSNVSISMPLSEQDVLAKVKSVLGAAPIRQSRPAPQLL